MLETLIREHRSASLKLDTCTTRIRNYIKTHINELELVEFRTVMVQNVDSVIEEVGRLTNITIEVYMTPKFVNIAGYPITDYETYLLIRNKLEEMKECKDEATQN